MKFSAIAILLFLAPAALALDKPLDIKVDRAGECTRKSKAGMQPSSLLRSEARY